MLSALLASVCVGVPCLLAFNLPPSSTFLNQAVALIGWGAWLLLLAGAKRPARASRSAGLTALQAALALLLSAALAAPLWAALPWSLSSAALIGAAAVAAQTAASTSRSGLALPAFRAFCIGLGLLENAVRGSGGTST